LGEGEPCGADGNGGCDANPPAFTMAVCGKTYYGSAWATGGQRDTDWYLVPHGGGILTATLVSQFPGSCFIVDGVDPDGVPCDPIVVGNIGCSANCLNIQSASADLSQGWYAVVVAPGDCAGDGVFSGYECGYANEYYVTIACMPGPMCAADEQCDDGDPCNGDEWCDEANTCQPAPPDPDCNDNGVLDACDLEDLTSLDCNGNSIPDECDIADQTSSDNNDDGIPDECQWCLTSKLVAADGAAYATLGQSVAASGAFIVIGAPGDDDFGYLSGSAYVFRYDGTNWIQDQKLLASDGEASDYFGRSVAISGHVAVVGATGDDDVGFLAGAAYVFRYDGSTWLEEQKLLAADGEERDRFGSSVAVEDDTVVVGAIHDADNGSDSGSSYVFRYDGATWVEEQKLLPSDGAANDEFGYSAGIIADTVLVGAPDDDDNGNGSGSMYVFRYDGATWVEARKLLASDGAAGDSFGDSVGISGDTVLVGAPDDDDNGSRSGSAYVFRYDGATWVEAQKLLASDGAATDLFGDSVAVSGEIAVIGAWGDDDVGSRSGSAYLFRYNGSTWAQASKLYPPDGASDDQFGEATAVTGDSAVVGAPKDDGYGSNVGSAYVFDLSTPCTCYGDVDGDNNVGVTDFLALLAAWGTNPGGPPDFDGDGTVGVLDFLFLLARWGPCP
jgi:hypothetical protein